MNKNLCSNYPINNLDEIQKKISPKNNIIIKGGLIFEKNNNYYFI